MRSLTISLATALVLAAGAAQADGKITITKQVWEGFQQYRDWVTAVGSGAYAITTDGTGGGGAGCPQANCMNPEKAGTMAIDRCQQNNAGKTCVIFARNQDPVMDYKIGE